jgi:hypothetical protein
MRGVTIIGLLDSPNNIAISPRTMVTRWQTQESCLILCLSFSLMM